MASGKGEMRAREFVSKIEDSEVRKQLLAYIDGALLNYHVGKKQTDQVLELVRKGELTHLLKVWALTESAKHLCSLFFVLCTLYLFVNETHTHEEQYKEQSTKHKVQE
jgi:hypothetical protein